MLDIRKNSNKLSHVMPQSRANKYLIKRRPHRLPTQTPDCSGPASNSQGQWMMDQQMPCSSINFKYFSRRYKVLAELRLQFRPAKLTLIASLVSKYLLCHATITGYQWPKRKTHQFSSHYWLYLFVCWFATPKSETKRKETRQKKKTWTWHTRIRTQRGEVEIVAKLFWQWPRKKRREIKEMNRIAARQRKNPALFAIIYLMAMPSGIKIYLSCHTHPPSHTHTQSRPDAATVLKCLWYFDFIQGAGQEKGWGRKGKSCVCEKQGESFAPACIDNNNSREWCPSLK